MTNSEKINQLKNKILAHRDTFEASYFCFSCHGVFDGTGEDACEKCGGRYSPTEENEDCPECGCEHYISYCLGCDSSDPDYLIDVIESWNEHFDDDYYRQFESDCIKTIETFVNQRVGLK